MRPVHSRETLKRSANASSGVSGDAGGGAPGSAMPRTVKGQAAGFKKPGHALSPGGRSTQRPGALPARPRAQAGSGRRGLL